MTGIYENCRCLYTLILQKIFDDINFIPYKEENGIIVDDLVFIIEGMCGNVT